MFNFAGRARSPVYAPRSPRVPARRPIGYNKKPPTPGTGGVDEDMELKNCHFAGKGPRASAPRPAQAGEPCFPCRAGGIKRKDRRTNQKEHPVRVLPLPSSQRRGDLPQPLPDLRRHQRGGSVHTPACDSRSASPVPMPSAAPGPGRPGRRGTSVSVSKRRKPAASAGCTSSRFSCRMPKRPAA